MNPKHIAITLLSIIFLSYVGIPFISAYTNMLLFIVSVTVLALWGGWKLSDVKWGWVIKLLMVVLAFGHGVYTYDPNAKPVSTAGRDCLGIFCVNEDWGK